MYCMTSIAQESNGPHLKYFYSDLVSFLKLQYPFIVSAWKKLAQSLEFIFLCSTEKKSIILVCNDMREKTVLNYCLKVMVILKNENSVIYFINHMTKDDISKNI